MNATIPCTCPPNKDGEPRHTEDTVTFRDRLDFQGAVTIRKAIGFLYANDPDAGPDEVLALMSTQYLLLGITSWSRVDEKGKPLEATRTAIRSFLDEHPDEAMTLVDPADDLYREQVLLPLLQKAQASSPPTPTSGSTSARTDGSEKRPRPLKRSSTSTSRTDGIETTSSPRDGVSSSSLNVTSAA